MSIVQLKSENKDFSYIISKNPETGMVSKTLRQGLLFGYFSEGDPTSYNIYFKDGKDEVSFPSYEGEEFEYLNVSRYNSAFFVVSAIDTLLRSAFKSDEYQTPDGGKKDEGGVENTFFINMILVKNDRYISAFEDYFPDYKVDAEAVSGKNYRIKITTKNSIFELLNFASLFGMFNSIVNNEPIFIQDDNIEKFINCMNAVNAPYFLRYLFKIRFIKGMKSFRKFKEKLDSYQGKELSFTFGDTWQARQMSIEDRLSFDKPILDVGCGEGKYITRFNRYMKGFNYYAIDIDPEERAKAEKRVFHKRLKNVHFFESIQKFIDSENSSDDKIDVICTEVVEHMPVEDAEVLMSKILSLNIGTLIVTTPDVRFNQNYFMTGMRHDDHDWEPTRQEFEDFVSRCLIGVEDKYTVEWFPIGDEVDGITPSQGIIIKSK